MTATVHRIWVAYVSPRTSFVLTYEGVVEGGVTKHTWHTDVY